MKGRLALAELRSATSGLQTVLLTFLHTRIAGEEASLLEALTKIGVGLDQRAADAVTDSASLTGQTATVHIDDDVHIGASLGEFQGLNAVVS